MSKVDDLVNKYNLHGPTQQTSSPIVVSSQVSDLAEKYNLHGPQSGFATHNSTWAALTNPYSQIDFFKNSAAEAATKAADAYEAAKKNASIPTLLADSYNYLMSGEADSQLVEPTPLGNAEVIRVWWDYIKDQYAKRKDERTEAYKAQEAAEADLAGITSYADYAANLAKYNGDSDAMIADMQKQADEYRSKSSLSYAFRAGEDLPYNTMSPFEAISARFSDRADNKALADQLDRDIAYARSIHEQETTSQIINDWASTHEPSRASYDEAYREYKNAQAAYDQAQQEYENVKLPETVGGYLLAQTGLYDTEEIERRREVAYQLKIHLDEAKAVMEYAKAHQWDNVPAASDYRQKVEEGKAVYEEFQAQRETETQDLQEDRSGTYTIASLSPESGLDTGWALAQQDVDAIASDDSYFEPDDRWTQEEKDVFYYLFATDQEQAYDYGISINQKYNAVDRENAQIETEESSTRNVVTGTLNSLGSVPANLAGGLIDYTRMGVETELRGQPYESRWNGPSVWAEDVRGSIGQSANEWAGTLPNDIPVIGGKGLGDLYQLMMSMADSSVAVAAGGGGANLMFFGASAASTTRTDLSKGISADKALAHGFAAGAAEVIGETLSVEHLLRQGDVADYLRKGLLKAANEQGLVEASEEVLTKIVETMADAVINGDESEFWANVYANMNNGMSYDEAVRRGRMEWLEDLCAEALGGYLSGGMMSGGRMGVQTVSAATRQYTGDAQGLIDAAKVTPADSKASKLADRYQGRVDKKGSLSEYQAAKLDAFTSAAINAADRPAVVSAVESRLKDQSTTKLSDKEVSRMAKAIVDQAFNGRQEGDSGFSSALQENVYRELVMQLNGETVPTGNWLNTEGLKHTEARTVMENRLKSFEVKSTGERIEVARATMKDGKLELSYEKDGKIETVSADDLKMDTYQQQALQTMVNILGDDAAYAFNGMRPSQKAFYSLQQLTAYANEFATIRDVYGRNGTNEQAALNSPMRRLLSDGQVLQAYNLGKEMGPVRAGDGTAVKRGSGNISLDGGMLEGREVGAVKDQDTVKNSAQFRALQRIAKAAGLDIVLYESEAVDDKGNLGDTPRGVYVQDGVVWLDWNAGVNNINNINDTTRWMIFLTMSHEVTHFLEENAKAEYAALRNFIERHMAEHRGYTFKDAVQAKMDERMISIQKGAKLKPLSYDEAAREVVADACETMLVRSEYVQAMADEDPGLFRHILDAIHNFFARLLGKGTDSFAGMRLSEESKAIRDVAAEVSKLWDNALRAAVENRVSEETLDESPSLEEQHDAGIKSAETLITDLRQQILQDAKNPTAAAQQAKLDRLMQGIATINRTTPVQRLALPAHQEQQAPAKKLTASQKAAITRRFNKAVEDLMFSYEVDGVDISRADAEAMITEYAALHDGYFSLYDEAKQKGELKTQKQYAESQRAGLDVNTDEETGVTDIVNENGRGVAAINSETGSAMFSLRTFREGGEAALNDFLSNQQKTGALTPAEVKQIRSQIKELYAICDRYDNGHYAPFSAWSNAEVVTYDGRPVFSVVKANGEYKLNLDFSLVCKKRRTLDAVFNEMIAQGIMDNFDMVQESIAKINDIIRDNGFETACGLCFVDSKRYRQGMIAGAFAKMYNDQVRSLVKKGQKVDYFNYGGNRFIRDSGIGIDTLDDSELDWTTVDKILRTEKKSTVRWKIADYLKNNPSARRLVMRGDFMSTAGFDAVKARNPELLKLYNSKKGAGGPKAAQSDVQYLNEIINSDSFNPKAAYEVGGVRIQSFSDYVGRLVFDYVQMTADLAAKKLPAHSYTKEFMFAQQFGLTGIKINMSLVPEVIKGGVAAGLDANGNYAWKDGQSFGSTVYDNRGARMTAAEGFELAKRIQNADGYSRNCGTIAVGVSDEHILKMLGDPDIRMIIPYHKSSLNHIVASMMNIDKYTDYTLSQNTRQYKNGKWCKLTGGDFNFNEALQRLGDAKAAANEYLAWCEENGYKPKFDQFADHENYYKLLEDFSCYDRDGVTNTPMGAVQMKFPTASDAFGSMSDLIEQGLDEDAMLQAKQEKAVPEIVKQIQEVLPEFEASVRERGRAKKAGKVQLSAREHTEAVQEDLGEAGRQEQRVQFSRRVSDPATLKFLNDQLERGDVIHTYKTFLEVIDEDGTVRLLPPMAAKQRDANGKLVWANSMAVNEWEESVGNPNSKGIISKINSKGETKWYYRLVKDNGKTVDAAYDPYQHSSDVVLNDQFEEAYQRPQLVTYECVIPKSELTSGYWYRQARADGQIVEAALPVGQHSWKKGTVAGRLKHTDRSVYLTRWLMPVRRVENSEVARMYKEILDKEDTPVAVPFNVVPPGLLTELEKTGVEIDYEGSPGYRYRANKKAATTGSVTVAKVQYNSRESYADAVKNMETISDDDYLAARKADPFVKVMDETPAIVLQKGDEKYHGTTVLQYSARTNEKSDRELLLDASESGLSDAEKRARAAYKAKVDMFRQRQQAATTALDALDKAVQAGDAEAANKARAKLTAAEKKMSEALAALTEAERGPELREILRRERDIQKQRTTARIRDSYSRRELRQRVDRLWKDLNKRITNPTEKKRIPVELMQQAIDVLHAINMDTTKEGSDRGQKLRDKLLNLQARYAELQKDPDFRRAAVYDAQVAEYLQNMIETVGDTPINRMSTEQLAAVYNALKALDTTARGANKVRLREQEIEAYQISKAMTEEVRSTGKEHKGLLATFINAQLTPERMFNRLGGYHKNSMWSQVFDMLNAGQLKQTQLMMEGSLIFEDLLQGKDYGKFIDPKNTVDIGLKDENGNSILITHGMMVALYMHLQNDQNRRHVAYGGLTIPALKDYYSGKKVKGSENAVRVGGVLQEMADLNDRIRTEEDAGVLADLEAQRDMLSVKALDMVEELQGAIEGKLTDYDRQWIAASRELFDGFSKRVLNETTLEIYGIKRATVENYMPIWVDGDFLNSPFESVAKDMSLENAGFMKERIDSSKPIRLADISDVTASQIRKVAQYSGLMPVVRAFNKVWGKTQTGYRDSLQKAVHETFGQNGVKYIENLMADLNGARGQKLSVLDETLNALRGHMAQASLTLNPRVALGQLASYPSAAAVLGWDALNKALASGRTGDLALIQKYSPLMWTRTKGMSTIELGDIASMNSKFDRLWKKASWATGWIQGMDVLATRKLWVAAEFYVEAHNKALAKGSDAFYQEVAKIYNKALENTQPMYSTLQRPDILRNPSTLLKQLTMFMTQRLQNFNILYDSLATYSTMQADFKAHRNGVTADDVKQAAANSRTAVLSQVAAAATIVAFKAIADVILHSLNAYRDDDKELTPESVSMALLDAFLDSLAGNVLGGSELYDFIESKAFHKTYYGISVASVSTVTDLIDSINNFYDALAKDNRNAADIIKKGNKLAQKIAVLAGIPLANAEKIINGGRYWIEDAINGELFSFEAGVDRTTAQQAHRLYRAYVAMDYDAVKKIQAEVPEDKQDELSTAVRSYIKQQYKDGSITFYEALRQMQKYGNASSTALGNFIKEQYKDGKINKNEAVNQLMKYTGKDKEAAEKTMREYSAEVETGTKFSEIEDQFLLGDLSATKAKQMLIKYGGLDADTAQMKLDFWTYQNKHAGTKLEFSSYKTYVNKYKAIGLTAEQYEDYSERLRNCKGVDADGDGKTDSGSKKKEVIALIASLDLTAAQKDQLYFANNYGASGLKDTPWHK